MAEGTEIRAIVEIYSVVTIETHPWQNNLKTKQITVTKTLPIRKETT